MKHPYLHRMMFAEGLQNVNCSVLSLSRLGYRMTLVRAIRGWVDTGGWAHSYTVTQAATTDQSHPTPASRHKMRMT